MARTKKIHLDPALGERICEALRAGNTRRAACAQARISEDTFARYLKAPDFAEAVREAEADCETALVQVLRDAADGVPTKTTKKHVQDVIKTKKTRRPVLGERRTTKRDGSVVVETIKISDEVIEEPVTVTVRSAETVESEIFDWRAGLELLKRRFRADWGDRAQVDVRNLTDEQLLALLAAEDPGAAPGGGG